MKKQDYNNWRTTIGSVIRLSKKQYSQRMRMAELAQKYYGTTDFSRLQPYQLDKLVAWTTGMRINQGSSKDRRHGRTLGRYIKGKL